MQATEKQRNAVAELERMGMAAVVQLPAFDFALVPHWSRINGVHLVGFKVASLALESQSYVNWLCTALHSARSE